MNWTGWGFALARKASNTGDADERSRCSIRLRRDGIEVATGTVDSGTRSSIAIRSEAARLWGLRSEDVLVVEGDTLLGPVDTGSTAQRSVHLGVAALREATAKAQSRIAAFIPEAIIDRWAWPFVHTKDGQRLNAWRSLIETSRATEFTASWRPQGPALSTAAVAHKLHYNPRLNTAHVERTHCIVDCGPIADTPGAYGQAYGSIAQSIGFTMREWGGKAVSNLGGDGYMRAGDMPDELTVNFVTPEGANPIPRGLGEIVFVASQAALTDAVAKSTGCSDLVIPLIPRGVGR